MQQKKVVFKSDGLTLEGRLLVPAETTAGPVPGVVLCHPHPLYGGSMNNNVIHAAGRALAGIEVAALLFNFRGVGLSEGAYDDGRGETEDARAAASYLASREEVDCARLGLCGYSFGGAVALDAAMHDDAVKAVAAVSPAGLPEFSGSKPRLIVCGAEDTLVPASRVLQEKERITGDGAGSVVVVAGADHFWGGFEGELARLLAEFFGRIFYSNRSGPGAFEDLD